MTTFEEKLKTLPKKIIKHSIGRAWKLTFTQQEIDRMQNSLEQIEVVE